MADTALAALKKQRAVNKGKLTNILNYVNKATTDIPIEQFKTRLARVEQLMEEFTAIENQIFSVDEAQNPDLEYEENYYLAVSGLNRCIRARSLSIGTTTPEGLEQTLNTSVNAQAHTNLPKINIPPFSGEYIEWQSFFDLFSSTIHESTSLSAVQKFQYLKGLLRGEAAVLLRHISITEANYIEALQKLKSRYDRKKLIINAFIRTFLEQPSISNANATNVKRLLDTADEVVRGLKALGTAAEGRDSWLIYILTEKLDGKSRTLWAQSSAELENPELGDLFKFLILRIDALESVGTSSNNLSSKRPAIKSHVTSNVFQCPICSDINHVLYQCPQFNELDVIARRDWVKSNNRCFNCLSSKHAVFRCMSKHRCQTCKGRHHTLLHLQNAEDQQIPASMNEDIHTNNPRSSNQIINAYAKNSSTATQSILPTVLMTVTDVSGKPKLCRALLDSGSQASFITENCVQRLGLGRRNGRISVTGLGTTEAGVTRGLVTIHIKPEVYSSFSVNAFILNKITTRLPEYKIDMFNQPNWKDVKLADPEFSKPNEIDVLIGIDHFFNILRDGQIKGNANQPILQNTIFGWIVAGNISYSQPKDLHSFCSLTNVSKVDIDRTLQRFWEVESIAEQKMLLTPEEELCENNFKKNVTKTLEGRFMVSLPFKKSPNELGSSFNMALQRFRALERRFTRDSEFYGMYKQFMSEYQSLGHMQEIEPNEMNEEYFLPHHGVYKQNGTTMKLRVVFDGSAKTTSGLSLNDCLAVGATGQSSLYAIVLRFREHRIVFAADIEKMYRQILVKKADSNYQKIIWRSNSSMPIRYFRLCTVTYGLSSAPFLATRAIKQVAIDTVTSDPIAAKHIESNIYIDDIMTGADTEIEAQHLKKSITTILSKYGFNLRKWMSNSPKLLEDVPLVDQEDSGKSIKEKSDTETRKLLGLEYNPLQDIFKFKVKSSQGTHISKREVLSEAGKIFDPLGWLAPVNIKIKIFIQRLWILNLAWDDMIPKEEADYWKKIQTSLTTLEEISIPRYINTTKHSKVELHGFCDASQNAYAAVVYCRVISDDKEVQISLISAKTKVAPLKQLSLPRLELCGAVLLTKLMNLVKGETNLTIKQIYMWTDSKIVLDWLASHPRRWSTFVANRTGEILTYYNRSDWGHLPSEENPADPASRGLFPEDLNNHNLWWKGPLWLNQTKEFWPQQQQNYELIEEQIPKMAFSAVIKIDVFETLLSKHSSFHKIQRILTYVVRFVSNCRKPVLARNQSKFLTRKEILESLYRICLYEQEKFFAEEVEDIRRSKNVRKTSSLKFLNPFIDEFGVLRVGGRLEKSNLPFSTKHPIILPPKSHVTRLIIEELHKDHKHAGPSLTIVRQQYWVPCCKNLLRKIVHQCVTCTRLRAKTEGQLMGTLPVCRVEFERAFTKVGIDFAGPLSIHLTKGRGQKTYKAYICVFICLSTKALHLELVGDLSTDGFIAALKRFVARRGVCQEIYSDNGSNFVGANNEMTSIFNNCIQNSNQVSHFLSRHAITWHFIPPSAPHFGGIWESAVKSTKFHLKRVIGETVLTLEEMITLLAEIESILNSRPLCVLSADDIDPLTPSHFLIGQPATKLPEYDLTHLKPSYLSRWQMVQYMSQHFWKRWNTEYITSMQQRTKWSHIKSAVKLHDVVVIKEDNVPVNKWLLGKIIKLHPGSDGITRVVTLKTKSGELKRPITKIVLLPIEPSASRPAECS